MYIFVIYYIWLRKQSSYQDHVDHIFIHYIWPLNYMGSPWAIHQNTNEAIHVLAYNKVIAYEI